MKFVTNLNFSYEICDLSKLPTWKFPKSTCACVKHFACFAYFCFQLKWGVGISMSSSSHVRWKLTKPTTQKLKKLKKKPQLKNPTTPKPHNSKTPKLTDVKTF